jgi:ATP synthase protein I
MTAMDNGDRLRENIERQAKRIANAEKERPTLLGQTVFLGTLALLLVVPMVGGAYLGRWLDSLSAGYTDRWTLSLMIAGLLTGAWSVYLYIKRH